MRRARLTFDGAIHHAMSRGPDGLAILPGDEDKKVFLELLEQAQRASRIGILAYCLLDNHYHLIVQERGQRMADFFKRLNGMYGHAYRRRHGGRGYVFQERYRSLLIQDDDYLKLCLAYVLNRPVKATLCRRYNEYRWSSAGSCFSREPPSWLEVDLIERLFGSESALATFVDARRDLDTLPEARTPMGGVIGEKGYGPIALERANRRSQGQSTLRKRGDDFDFEPVEKVLREFAESHGVRLEGLDLGAHGGKRLRAELLVHLKDRSGLTYRELAEMDLFANLRMSGLGALYQRAKQRNRRGGGDNVKG